MKNSFNNYISEFSSKENDTLKWLVKQTHLRTNNSRMLCGAIEGKLLELLSCMIKPEAILEIGTFTGYSAICLSKGLTDNGILDALELNEELEDLILEGFEKAGIKDKANLIIGDANKSLLKLIEQGKKYDLVFIDANKREYCNYYSLIKKLVKPGSYILADNVLWDGKVYQEPMPNDKQTTGIYYFNKLVNNDPSVENIIIPLRDGINLIRVL